uniref:Uncharacterized protein n=1 Tax=Peronospora matthiolae TaxID=2874970 RepID=A0AAV1U950_9STRA
MSTTSSPVAAPPCLKTPRSVQCLALSPRKRKLSATEAASPTSLDEVATNGKCKCKTLGEHGISPKKKIKVEDRGSHSHTSSCDLLKWESHVVPGTVASALDLDAMEMAEPISLLAEPAGDLPSDDLELLCRFLA